MSVKRRDLIKYMEEQGFYILREGSNHTIYTNDTKTICEIIEGNVPKNKQRLVQAWIEIHREDLMTDWRLAVSGQNPMPIKPLE